MAACGDEQKLRLAPELTELADNVLAAMGVSGLTPYNALHLRVEGMRKAELLALSSSVNSESQLVHVQR